MKDEFGQESSSAVIPPARLDAVLAAPMNRAPSAGYRFWTGPWWQQNWQLVMDFVTTFGLLIIFAALETATPRVVFMVQATLYKHSYPYKDNSVPSSAVPVYSICTPLIAFLVWRFVPGRRPVTWFDFYRCFLACLFAIFLAGAITNALKVAIGRPRPNFLYQCWPDGVPVWQNGTSTTYGGYPLCADPVHAEEFYKSFPSGHSSWSAAGLGFLSFWMLGQTHAFVGGGRSWLLFLSSVPALVALIVGISRITDYWHNVSDVCFGLALGYIIALLTYLQLFPFFTNPHCHVPRYVIKEALRAGSRASPNSPVGGERVAGGLPISIA